VAKRSPPALPGHRPDPPADLSPDEAAEWQKLVGCMPAGWFTIETHPILAQLCRAICRSRALSAWLSKIGDLSKLDDSDFELWKVFSGRQIQLAGQIGSLSTKLRLTPSSRVPPALARARTAAHRTSGALPGTDGSSIDKPWHVDVDVDDPDEHRALKSGCSRGRVLIRACTHKARSHS
jgi:hypothetical protein